ncbi:hypothetical protein BDZ45DRAFT_755571 [Acephala macrosclerotiorum]|nr:hypothetical protein BDZ45DRAFT_755571 [Acephala macrosclerotiorum]
MRRTVRLAEWGTVLLAHNGSLPCSSWSPTALLSTSTYDGSAKGLDTRHPLMFNHFLNDEARPDVKIGVYFYGGNGPLACLNFALYSESQANQILEAVDAARQEVYEKASEASKFRRICQKYTTSQRNESDHERLFSIRYGDSEELSILRDFLKDLPLGAFIKVIFKISYADLISIKNHLHDLARFAGSPNVELRHAGKLLHLKGYELFCADCKREGEQRTADPRLPTPALPVAGFITDTEVTCRPDHSSSQQTYLHPANESSNLPPQDYGLENTMHSSEFGQKSEDLSTASIHQFCEPELQIVKRTASSSQVDLLPINSILNMLPEHHRQYHSPYTSHPNTEERVSISQCSRESKPLPPSLSKFQTCDCQHGVMAAREAQETAQLHVMRNHGRMQVNLGSMTSLQASRPANESWSVSTSHAEYSSTDPQRCEPGNTIPTPSTSLQRLGVSQDPSAAASTFELVKREPSHLQVEYGRNSLPINSIINSSFPIEYYPLYDCLKIGQGNTMNSTSHGTSATAVRNLTGTDVSTFLETILRPFQKLDLITDGEVLPDGMFSYINIRRDQSATP